MPLYLYKYLRHYEGFKSLLLSNYLNKIMNNDERISLNKEEIYSKLYDSSDYLLDYHALLPKSIKVNNESIDLRLNKQDITKLKNIIWYISNSKLWN